MVGDFDRSHLYKYESSSEFHTKYDGIFQLKSRKRNDLLSSICKVKYLIEQRWEYCTNQLVISFWLSFTSWGDDDGGWPRNIQFGNEAKPPLPVIYCVR